MSSEKRKNTSVMGKATCTEDGYTGDEICDDCGKVAKAGEAIPALGHNYKDGVCTRCGAKDPSYNPVKPDPVDPDDPDGPDPVDPDGSDPVDPDNPDDPVLPDTGDSALPFVAVTVLLLAGVCCVLAAKRRVRN